MCSGQKNPSWATWGKQASRRMTSTPKSQLCQRNRELDHEFHVNNVQGDRKIQADMKKTGIEGDGQKNPIWEMWTEQFTSRCRWDKKNIYPAKKKMCPAAKRNVSGRKRFPNGRWSLSNRDCHTLWNHRTSSFTNKQMMDSASIYRQRNQQRHKKTTHPKQGGKLKQVLP